MFCDISLKSPTPCRVEYLLLRVTIEKLYINFFPRTVCQSESIFTDPVSSVSQHGSVMLKTTVFGSLFQ